MEPSNWQIGLSTIRKRTEYAFNNLLFCDVEFSVVDGGGDVATLSASKYMLAVASPVFEVILYGDLGKSNQPIHLQDCSKKGLEQLLCYVHTEKVFLDADNVREVLHLAEKYMISTLADECRNFIKTELLDLTPENVFSFLSPFAQTRDKILELHYWDIIDKKTLECITSESFLNISSELLTQVLCRDSLRVSELDLFQAVERWATKKVEQIGLDFTPNGETKRAVLGEDVIRLIRFPLMTQKEFAEAVLPTEILQQKEVTEVIQLSNSLEATTDLFSKKPRAGQDQLLTPSNRFERFRRRSFSGNLWSDIDFRVNKAVNLAGIRMFGKKGEKNRIKIRISKRLDDGTYDSLCSFRSTCQTEEEKIDGLTYGFTLSFYKPIQVDPGIEYVVRISMNEPPSYFGCNGKSVVTCRDLRVTYTNPTLRLSDPLYNGVNPIEGGQFQTMLFTKAIE